MEKTEYLLSENDICQAIAEWLVEYKNCEIEKGTISFEKLKNDKYSVIVYEYMVQ